MITPSSWNTNGDTYAANEDIMIDQEGSTTKKQYREQIFMSYIPEDNAMMKSVQILSDELAATIQVLQRSNHVLEDKVQP